MIYGFLYKHYNDFAFLLYALQNYPFKKTNKGDGTVVFAVDNDEFIFTKNDNILTSNCKTHKKILLCHNDWNNYDTTLADQIIMNFPGESVPTHVTDERLLNFMNANNICISSGVVLFNHSNFIFDNAFNLIYFYYWYGYNYLNFYKNKTTRTNLLGMYYNPIHISGNVSPTRENIYHNMKEVLGNDLHVYEKRNSNMATVIESYNYVGIWEKNHVSSYTDFVTSACTFIFETNQTRENEDLREHMTEKTLKGIIFSEVDVFVIWYGSKKQYRYLKDNGFWFLNFEFYDESSNEEFKITKSIIDTVMYLKHLKNNLGTDDNVHKYLIEKYGHKLEQNVKIFKNLLNNCQKTDYILQRIRN